MTTEKSTFTFSKPVAFKGMNARQLRRAISRLRFNGRRKHGPKGVPPHIVAAVMERTTEKGRQTAVQSFIEKGKVAKLRAKTMATSEGAEAS